MSTFVRTDVDTPALANTEEDPRRRAPLVLGRNNYYASVTEKVCGVNEAPWPPRGWYVAFGISFSLLLMLVALIGYMVLTGVGILGNNIPVAWGFPIANFVFWVGIAHAGTLISAILHLFRQQWRTSINRFAEAMTIFAVICAGLWPAIHIGRAWLPYWLFPYPNQMGMWPQFRSPLIWDAFAVGTYFTVSLMFWYTGMIPDLASLRDRATTRVRQVVYGILSLGWRGSARHWLRYERAYLLLAALATPLVLSVHSVVSFDFAVAQLPGWHTTVFPPYFVAGAIYSGFALVITLAIPCRQWLGLKELITMRHLDNMAKIMLATGCIVGYAYLLEAWTAWYSGHGPEQFMALNRAFGPQYWWAYWIMVACNALIPQVLWWRRLRENLAMLFAISIVVNIGMWFERFVIVVTSLKRDFLPSSWDPFVPTWVDICMLLGSFGLFFTLFLLFLRFLPPVAASEVKGVIHETHGNGKAETEGH